MIHIFWQNSAYFAQYSIGHIQPWIMRREEERTREGREGGRDERGYLTRPTKYTHCVVVLAIIKNVSLLHKNKSRDILSFCCALLAFFLFTRTCSVHVEDCYRLYKSAVWSWSSANIILTMIAIYIYLRIKHSTSVESLLVFVGAKKFWTSLWTFTNN